MITMWLKAMLRRLLFMILLLAVACVATPTSPGWPEGEVGTALLGWWELLESAAVVWGSWMLSQQLVKLLTALGVYETSALDLFETSLLQQCMEEERVSCLACPHVLQSQTLGSSAAMSTNAADASTSTSPQTPLRSQSSLKRAMSGLGTFFPVLRVRGALEKNTSSLAEAIQRESAAEKAAKEEADKLILEKTKKPKGLRRMSSSFKNFKIKAFRKSKDVELVNTVQEQETPAPGKKKISAKARKMAARLVPAALGGSPRAA
ncbi:hypothetical protein WJX79_002823 [Trebouxia sp. C0005]